MSMAVKSVRLMRKAVIDKALAQNPFFNLAVNLRQ